LVDTSRSQTGVLDLEREVSHTFFDRVLREDKDLAYSDSRRKYVMLCGVPSSRNTKSSRVRFLAMWPSLSQTVASRVTTSSPWVENFWACDW
jgi:hypothetical protein